MLHIELYERGTKDHALWLHTEERPKNLLDPTNLLKDIKNEWIERISKREINQAK